MLLFLCTYPSQPKLTYDTSLMTCRSQHEALNHVAPVVEAVQSQSNQYDVQINELMTVLKERDITLADIREKSRAEVSALNDTIKVQADELEVVRQKAAKAARLEATIEKLNAKLEGMTDLQHSKKQLEHSLSDSAKRLREVEAQLGGVQTLKQEVQELRSQVITAQAALSEATALSNAKEQQLVKLRAEKHDLVSQRSALEASIEKTRHERLDSNPSIGSDIDRYAEIIVIFVVSRAR
jgi:chromosome segregation ATPase